MHALAISTRHLPQSFRWICSPREGARHAMTNKSTSPPGPLTVEALTAAIHKHYCELEGECGAIYDGPDGRAKTEAQGAKVISAIVKVGCQNEDEYHPADASTSAEILPTVTGA